MDKKSELDQAIDLIVSEDPRENAKYVFQKDEPLNIFFLSPTPVWMFILGVVVLTVLIILF